MPEGKDGIIKRAVKEALDDKRLDDISKQVSDLGTQMATGFSAVHTRQDIANGRTSKNETEVTILKEKLGDANSWKAWLLPTLTAILTGLAVFVLTHK